MESAGLEAIATVGKLLSVGISSSRFLVHWNLSLSSNGHQSCQNLLVVHWLRKILGGGLYTLLLYHGPGSLLAHK